MIKNNIKNNKILWEFILKLGIIGVLAFILGFIKAFFEFKLGEDISKFVYFLLGYISCLLFDWRWFSYADREREKEKNR